MKKNKLLWALAIIAVSLMLLTQPKEIKKQASTTPLMIQDIESLRVFGAVPGGDYSVAFYKNGEEALATYNFPEEVYDYPTNYDYPLEMSVAVTYSGEDTYDWIAHITYDGGQEIIVPLPYAGYGGSGVNFAMIADDGSIYFPSLDSDDLLMESPGLALMAFRTSSPYYLSGSTIAFNGACNGGDLQVYESIASNAAIGDPCNTLFGSPILASLPGSPNVLGGTNTNLYFYLGDYFVCGNGYYSRYSGVSSGTDTSYSYYPEYEVECIFIPYSDFISYKNTFLNGGSFSTFITNANQWVS